MLHVIGAGLGRTGTYSLKLALEQLGFGPCHHMEEVLKDPERQVPLWRAAAEGRPDWAKALAGYRSAVDWPTAAFWRELAEAYPQAKVILTTRSAESWCASYSQTIQALMAKADEATERFRPWFAMAIAITVKSGLGGKTSQDEIIKAFNDHADAVRSAVPAERLLVYEVKEGWAPLCTFLGRAQPAMPFPTTNNRKQFWDLARAATG